MTTVKNRRCKNLLTRKTGLVTDMEQTEGSDTFDSGPLSPRTPPDKILGRKLNSNRSLVLP